MMINKYTFAGNLILIEVWKRKELLEKRKNGRVSNTRIKEGEYQLIIKDKKLEEYREGE